MKVGKITEPFRYDLNKIPYDYSVEVRNRFKGLDLIEGVPEELWMEVCDTVHEAGVKTIPKKNKCKEQNGCLKRPYKYLRKEEKGKTQEKKERFTHLNAEFRRRAQKDQKAFFFFSYFFILFFNFTIFYWFCHISK